MRILAIDPGSKRIGLAISDSSGVIAYPLKVLKHNSRLVDAATVCKIAQEFHVAVIVIGLSLGDNGQPTIEGRRACRFGEAIKAQLDVPIVFWDEAFTTKDARTTRIQMGVKRTKRSGHLDSLSAVILLQSYMDYKSNG